MYICTECKEKCQAVSQDLGVGLIEVHGRRTLHQEWTVVSDCCEAPVETENGLPVSHSDLKADQADERADRLYDEERDRRLMERIEKEND